MLTAEAKTTGELDWDRYDRFSPILRFNPVPHSPQTRTRTPLADREEHGHELSYMASLVSSRYGKESALAVVFNVNDLNTVTVVHRDTDGPQPTSLQTAEASR